MAEIAYLSQLTYDEAVDNLAHDLDVRRAIEEERLVHDQEEEEAEKPRRGNKAQGWAYHSHDMVGHELLAKTPGGMLQLASRQPVRGVLRQRFNRHAPGHAHDGYAMVQTWLSQQAGGQIAIDQQQLHMRVHASRHRPWRLQRGSWHDRFMSQLANLNNALPIFSPHSRGRQWWDTFIMLLVLYNAVTVPLDVSYGMPTTGNIANHVEYAVDLVFAVDIASTFRTAFVDHAGHLVRDTDVIAVRYLRMWFWIDLFATIPYDLLVGAIAGESSSTQITVLGFLRTPRLLRLGRLIRLLDRLKGANLVRVFAVVALMMLISHWLACIWYMLYKFTSFADYMGWGIFLQGSIQPDSTVSAYLSAYYQSFLMMVGNSQPSYNNLERVFMILVLILGACFYSAMVGQMAVLVANVNTVGLRHRMKQDTTMDVLRYMGLPDDQMQRVHAYFGYIMQVNHPAAEGLAFLTDLPKGLLKDVTGWLYQNELAKVTMFADLEPSFLACLAVRMRIVTFTPGETIFRAGDLGLEMYIIRKGCVAVVGKRDQLMGMLTAGDSFGEIAMFTMAKRTARCVALSSCDLCVLNTYDLKVAMKDFPSSSQQLQAQAQAKLRQLQVAGLAGYVEEHVEQEDMLHTQASQLADSLLAHKENVAAGSDAGQTAGAAQINASTIHEEDDHTSGPGAISRRQVRRTQSNLSRISWDRTIRHSRPTGKSQAARRRSMRTEEYDLVPVDMQHTPALDCQQRPISEGQEAGPGIHLGFQQDCQAPFKQGQGAQWQHLLCTIAQPAQATAAFMQPDLANTRLRRNAASVDASSAAAVAEGRDSSLAGSFDVAALQSGSHSTLLLEPSNSMAMQQVQRQPVMPTPFAVRSGKQSSAASAGVYASVDGSMASVSVPVYRQGSVQLWQDTRGSTGGEGAARSTWGHAMQHMRPMMADAQQWVRVAATNTAGPRVFTSTSSVVVRAADKGHSKTVSCINSVSSVEAGALYHVATDVEHGVISPGPSGQQGKQGQRSSSMSRPSSGVPLYGQHKAAQPRKPRPRTAIMGGRSSNAPDSIAAGHRSSYNRSGIDRLQIDGLEQLLRQTQLHSPAPVSSHAAVDLGVDDELGADWLRVASCADGVRMIRAAGGSIQPTAEHWRSSAGSIPASLMSALHVGLAAARGSATQLHKHGSVAYGSEAGDARGNRQGSVTRNSTASIGARNRQARASNNAPSGCGVPVINSAAHDTSTRHALGTIGGTAGTHQSRHAASRHGSADGLNPALRAVSFSRNARGSAGMQASVPHMLSTHSIVGAHVPSYHAGMPSFHDAASLTTHSHSHASEVEALRLQLTEAHDAADRDAAAAAVLHSQLFKQISSLLQLVEGVAARVLAISDWMDAVDEQLHGMEAMQASLTHKDNVLGTNMPMPDGPHAFLQQLQRSSLSLRASGRALALINQPSHK